MDTPVDQMTETAMMGPHWSIMSPRLKVPVEWTMKRTTRYCTMSVHIYVMY